jgi:hypothetical protein
VVGGLESALGGALDAKRNQFSEGFDKYLSAQEKLADNIADPIKNGLDNLTKPVPKLPELPKPKGPVTFDAKMDPETLAVDIKPRLGKAVMAGSAESQALRFGALAAVPSGGMKSVDVGKKQLDEAKKQTASLTQIASKIAADAVVEAIF